MLPAANARNTSCTDLLALLEAKWFGNPSHDGSEHEPELPPAEPPLLRRPSGSQLSSGRRSGSSERLVVGSGDGSLGAAVLAFQPGAAGGGEAYEVRSARLPQQPHGQQAAQQGVQATRTRSEPLPANGVYEPALNGVPAGGAKPGGGPQGQGGGGDAGQPAHLGTWANRQRVFLQQQAKQEGAAGHAAPIREEEEGGPSTSAAGFGRGAPSASRPAGNGASPRLQPSRCPPQPPQQPASESVDEEDELNAAWRWRFARKWQTEQAKQFDPEYGREGGDDEWGDALGYMDALAGGLNLQIARTVSTDQYASLSLMSPTLSQSMLLDASIKESPLTSTIEDSTSMNATRHIVAVARRAQQLLQQQEEIERQVEQRWESATAGQPWVGQHLAAVTVDSWGRFPFVLVRLLDRSSRHKVLVRGKNGSEEGALFSQLEQEVSRAAVQHRLPGPRLELLGSGVMEWSRERDRCLNVTASKLHSLTDARLRSKADVSKLAAALAQSSLPVTYRLLVEGRPMS